MTVIVLDQMRTVTVTASGPTSAITVSQTGMQGPQGNPTIVNGKSGASITLVPSDIGAVATTAVGAVNGVASLDSGGLVPYAQLPVTAIAGAFMDLSTNQTVSSGTKTFTLAPIVPDTPATAHGAINKTYTDTLYLSLGGGTLTGGLTVPSVTGATTSGGTLTLASTSNATKGKILFGTSAYDEVNNRLGIRNTSPSTAIHATAAAGATLLLRLDVSADTVGRFTVDSGGAIAWGPGGSTATDTTLNRSAAGQLSTNAQILMNGSNAAGLLLLQNGVATTTDPGTISIQETASTNNSIGTYVVGDTIPRWQMAASGKMNWGPGGSTATDTNLYRAAVGSLKTDTALSVGTTLTVTGAATFNTQIIASGTANPIVQATSTTTGGQIYRAIAADVTTVIYEGEVTGDSIHRWAVLSTGQIQWGPGSAGRDTNLYRNAAGVLKTDTAFVAGTTISGTTDVQVNGSSLGRGYVVASVTTTSNGSTGGATETADSVLGTLQFTAISGRRYQVGMNGLHGNSAAANDRYAVRIRDSGSSSAPTNTSTLVAESTWVGTVAGTGGRNIIPLCGTFIAGSSGTHTLEMFSATLSGTGPFTPVTGPSSLARELYVEDLGTV